jgi:sulfonate transport system permease protein
MTGQRVPHPLPSRGGGLGWRGALSAIRPLVALALWEAAARATAGSFLIAGPVEIAGWLTANAALTARALATTLNSAACGFLIGNLAAVVLAVLSLLVPRLSRMTGALALLVFCLPFVATGPILRVLYGPGIGPQVTLSALAVYYTTYLALLVGLRAAPAAWFDLVRSYGRGPLTALLRVRARAAVPYLVASLQIAAPAAFLGAMVGEFTGAERGLGVLTIRTTRALDVPGTWAIAAVAAAVSMLAYRGFGALGRRLAVAPAAVLLTPPPAASDPGVRTALRLVVRAVVTVAVVLLLWQALMDAFGLNAFFAKRPGDVWAFLVTSPGAGAQRAALLQAFVQTMVLAVPGYAAGLALGAGLAMALALRPGLDAAILPLSVALRSVPIVTTAPLIVLALGRGATGTIAVTAVMIFFPTLVACLNGLRQTPGQVGDVFASYAATPLQRLIHAQIPAMLPAFFAAARMAVPAAILAATTTEWLATGIGMGTLMALSASTSAYAMLWSAIALLSVTAALAYLAVEAVERRVLARYAPEQLA